MSVIETKVSFAHKGEEIKRVERKNNKYNLASYIVDIREIVFDEEMDEIRKLQKIKDLTTRAYW